MITDPFMAYILHMDRHHLQKLLRRKCVTLAETRSTVFKIYFLLLILIVFLIADVFKSQLYIHVHVYLITIDVRRINLLQNNVF